MELYKPSIQIDPYFTPAYLDLVQIYSMLKDRKGALETLNSVLKIDPGNGSARQERLRANALPVDKINGGRMSDLGREKTTGDGYGLRPLTKDPKIAKQIQKAYYPLDRGVPRRTSVGHCQSGRGSNLPFHSSRRSRGTRMKSAGRPHRVHQRWMGK
jgi:hypothetical protein